MIKIKLPIFFVYLKRKSSQTGRKASYTPTSGSGRKYSDDGSVLSRVYLKDNLVALCEAYGVGFRRNSTKQVLAASLAEAIRNNSSLPYITPVDDRQYKVVETVSDERSGAVRIRLRLTGKQILLLGFFKIDVRGNAQLGRENKNIKRCYLKVIC